MKPILIIDPGHGGTDSGGGSNQYFKEKDLVLEISRYQAERFKQLGVAVQMTRMTDEYLSATERTLRVQDSGAKFCISNHINSAGNPSARGVETIHSIHNDGKLAKAIFDSIVSAGMHGRRVFMRALESNKAKDYYFMHRETGNVTTIIVEYGFASNDEDAQMMVKYWRDYAEAVVRAFCRFIDHPYTPPTPIPGSEDTPAIQRSVAVLLDGKRADGGYLINGKAYLPARFFAEVFGATVGWSGEYVVVERNK